MHLGFFKSLLESIQVGRKHNIYQNLFSFLLFFFLRVGTWRPYSLEHPRRIVPSPFLCLPVSWSNKDSSSESLYGSFPFHSMEGPGARGAVPLEGAGGCFLNASTACSASKGPPLSLHDICQPRFSRDK